MQLTVTKEFLESVRRYVEQQYEEPIFEERFAAEAFECPSAMPYFSAAELPSEPMPQFSAAPTATAKKPSVFSRVADFMGGSKSPLAQEATARSLTEVIDQVEETFSESLFRLIDQRGLEDPEVYKRARVDRKLFSKIRSNANYQPSKSTALCLALALELNLDETLDFIGRAGFTLTHANKADIAIEYLIDHQCWDIQTINEVLFELDLPLL